MLINRNSLTAWKNMKPGWRFGDFGPHMVVRPPGFHTKSTDSNLTLKSFSACCACWLACLLACLCTTSHIEQKQDFQFEIKINNSVHIRRLLTLTHRNGFNLCYVALSSLGRSVKIVYKLHTKTEIKQAGFFHTRF